MSGDPRDRREEKMKKTETASLVRPKTNTKQPAAKQSADNQIRTKHTQIAEERPKIITPAAKANRIVFIPLTDAAAE